MFAFDTDFENAGTLRTDFSVQTNTDRGFYEVPGEGLEGSRALGLPFANQTQVIATTRKPVTSWTLGSTVTLAGYFKASIADHRTSNRRALAFGISNNDNVTPRPKSEKDPVYPNAKTFFAGIYTRTFDIGSGTIKTDFHLSGSQPNKTYSLTSNPVTLRDGQWYFMEVRFTEYRQKLLVDIALAHVDNKGALLEVLHRDAMGYGNTPVDFPNGDSIHGFIYSRDPQFSGVKTVDSFRAE